MDGSTDFEEEISDFSWMGYDPEAENKRFHNLVLQCDMTREWDVYIRQSQTSAPGKRDSYLLDQRQIPAALIECGVPHSKIVARELDINKSGALPISYRNDFVTMRDRIRTRVTGTVAAADIARLFRDRSLKGPTEFMGLLEMRSVKLLTGIEGHWELLDMAQQKDRSLFLQECQKAASERLTIRSRLGSSRLRLLRNDRLAWSGGPIDIGYAVTQPRRLKDGENTRRQRYIYEPHAEVVKSVLRVALRPELVTWPQFRDYCWGKGITVPPFSPEIREDVGPKSVLYDHGQKNMDVPHKLSVFNLQTILRNVLLLGDRLYGTGKSAKHTLNAVKKIEELEGQILDCKVREHRLPLDAEPVPELAILKTEEEQALFWEAAKKWLPYDLRAIRDAGYLIHPSLWPANKEQTAGKPHSGKQGGGLRTHPWAGHVFCWKHGESDDGWPVRTHPMQFRGADCICYKDHREGGHNQFCSVWGGKNGLALLLTNLLIARVGQWLEENHRFLGDIVDERIHAKAKVEHLTQSLTDARKRRDGAVKTLSDLRKRMETMDADFVEAQLAEIFAAAVRPAMLAVQGLERELKEAERAGLTTSSSVTEEELRAELSRMVSDRNLPADKLSSLIDLFVHEVGILTSRHVTEAVIVVRWRDRRTQNQKQGNTKLAWLAGAHEILLTWRNWNRDDREWTDEEDAALQRLWPASSGASYEGIKSALLPGRAWNKIYRRAHDLKLTDGSRSRQWQIAARKSEETLGDRNPDLGSMLLEFENGWHDLMEWAEGEVGQEENVWAFALGKDGDILGENRNPFESSVKDCVQNPLGGWELPRWTEERLKIVLSGVGYGPRCRPFSNIPRSPLVCGLRHPGFDLGAYIG